MEFHLKAQSKSELALKWGAHTRWHPWVCQDSPRSPWPKRSGQVHHLCGEGNGTPLQYSFAWKTPWTEEPGGLQSMGSLRVGHDWVTSLWLFTFMYWRRKWQPTPMFLPGESQGRGKPGGLPSMGSHRVGHDWSDLAAGKASSHPCGWNPLLQASLYLFFSAAFITVVILCLFFYFWLPCKLHECKDCIHFSHHYSFLERLNCAWHIVDAE